MSTVRPQRTARAIWAILRTPAVATPIALALVAIVSASVTGRTPGTAEGNDVRVYREGAEGFGLNGSPYGTGFVSPVQFALLLQPLRLIPTALVGWLWLAIGAAAVGLIVVAAFEVVDRAPNRVWAPIAGLALLAWPANAYGLELGQNSVLVGALLTVAVGSTRAAPTGAMLAFAAAMKPHLTVLVLAGIAFDEVVRSRSRRTLAEFAVVSLGLCVLALLYARAWVDVLLTEPPQSWNYWGSTIGANVMLAAALEDSVGAWLSYGVIVTTVLLLLGIWRLQSHPTRGRFAAALLSATLLVTPYAYPHDYVILALPIIWAVLALARRRHVAAALAIPVLLALAWLAPMPARYDDARFVALLLPLALLAISLVLPDPPRERPSAQ